jgi:hypothetical protein
MSGYQLLRHRGYALSTQHLPPLIQRKATWAQVLLGARGRTPSVKGTTGFNARWRRTPVQGSHYYLWWIPASESGMSLSGWERDDVAGAILVHSIRHHDQTDEPIDVGAPQDYEEAPLARLDPRFDEQVAISEQVIYEHAVLSTIKGLPGSGKSVSLLYLAKDLTELPELRKVRYVTYTQRLKRAAKEIIAAHDPELAQRLTVHTIHEVVSSITGISIPDEPFAEARDFIKYLEMQNPATLGPWKKYPLTLYTELRAHLFGRTFPAGYQLPAARLDQLRLAGSQFDVEAYAARRELNTQLAGQAVNLAQRLVDSHFFVDQKAALKALELLQKGAYPRWLAEADAIVIDEVQDLTLLQIALVGEMARLRLGKGDKRPFSFTVAGDESQIVQPSGFDWGVTKDLLAEELGAYPHDHDFRHQRRSPLYLAHLIDNSWNFYAHLPKALRPSARRQEFELGELTPAAETTPEEGADNGLVILCPPPNELQAQEQWEELFNELTDKPGRIVVDLTEELANRAPRLPDDEANEVLFLPREIKGLERATVVIYGLDIVYERALDLCHDDVGLRIPLLEARRLFDEMRVALSRSTNRLVLLAAGDARIFNDLELRKLNTLRLDWRELVEFLQADEMTEIEIVEGLLDEVDDLVERGRWEQALRRNRRAYELAVQIGDHALQREAQGQYIDAHAQECERRLAHGDLHGAHELAGRTRELAVALDDPIIFERVDELWESLQAAISLQLGVKMARAQDLLQQGKLEGAYHAGREAMQLARFASSSQLSEQFVEMQVETCTAWARQILAQRQGKVDSEHVAALFEEAAGLLQSAGDGVGAAAMGILAERYRAVAPQHHLSQTEIRRVLDLARQYVAVTAPLGVGEAAYMDVVGWLAETFANLGGHSDLYYEWALTGQEVAHVTALPRLDEWLWDLEHRLEMESESHSGGPNEERFRAFLAAYNGDALEASLIWERLGEMDLAIEQARSAGDLERAHTLLRQTKQAIPEDLATAVKAVRLMQQLGQKHLMLRPAEQRTLLEELVRLHAIISETLPPEEE